MGIVGLPGRPTGELAMLQKYFTYKLIAWLVCLLAGMGAQARAAWGQAAGAGLPDIIYILSDDQAYTDYSFMGISISAHRILTNWPKRAVCSRAVMCPIVLCRPSLATIITGLYPHQHGIVGNDPPPPAAGMRRESGLLTRRLSIKLRLKSISNCISIAWKHCQTV